MALTPGTRLGVYEVTAQIGEGGMGQVYRARDTKLDRDVAIKILPEAFAHDADRLARFQREAKTLASLNHPNIAIIHGLEQAGDIHALVMELVEGEDLSQRIARGAIPLNEALPIARQIAEGLEAAHEQGIIHRDLKPANVKVRPDGTVKVLDFGLAKAMEPPPGSSPSVSMSPTITSPAMMTGVGMILGTAAYMAPEQAKGSPADHRSDIFSFGSVFYEMLTGRQPFRGDSVAEMLASVLARDVDLTALPPNLNPRLVELLRRCFEKNPKRRWQAVGDLRCELETISAAPFQIEPAAMGARPLWRRAALPLAGALIAAAVGGGIVASLRPPAELPIVTRFSLAPLPGGLQFNFGNPSFAISPDGTHITYATSAGLYVRSMSELDGTLIIPATPTISFVNPVFSPDSHSIAFVSEGALKRIPVTGGTPFTICPLPPGFGFGLSWEGDQILFGGASAIRRVAPSGGAPQDLVPLKQGEWGWAPRQLPGGEWILMTVAKGLEPEAWDAALIVAQSTMSGERRVLVEGGRDARYLPSGQLVFARGGVLFAAPFDATRVELLASPVPVVDGVRRSAVNGTSHFSVSNTGSLVYMPGPTGFGERRVEMVQADRNGVVDRVLLPPGPYDHPRVSPDGRLVAFGTVGDNQDIWIYDLAGSAAPRRATFGAKNRFPIWSADGRRIVFQSDREGDLALYWQPADGSGTAERLTKPEGGAAHVPDAWLPGQDRFLFSIVKDARRTLWTSSVRNEKIEPFDSLQTVMPRGVAVSPDGKWIAYVGSIAVGGATEGVYVQPVPATGAKYQISERTQGQMPVWSLDGREIIFIPGGGSLAAVRLEAGAGFAFSKPVPLRRGFTENLGPVFERNYDVTRDGKFIGFVAPGQSQTVTSTGQINVVLNWFVELKAKVPIR